VIPPQISGSWGIKTLQYFLILLFRKP
jgi:hypothetical protein